MAVITARSTSYQNDVIIGLQLRQTFTSGCRSSSGSPMSRVPIEIRVPTDPPYPRANSAILPFCGRWLLTPCSVYHREKCSGEDEFDSFITYRNRYQDFEKLKKIGVKAYQKEQSEKVAILNELLENYNDGRKYFFVWQ